MNGVGNQPYETLVPLGVGFDGGYYVHDGRYRGRLTGTEEQINNAILSMAMFGVAALTDAAFLTIVETLQPTNTEVTTPTGDVEYLGPATLDSEGRVVRPTSPTPF